MKVIVVYTQVSFVDDEWICSHIFINYFIYAQLQDFNLTILFFPFY